MKTLFLVLIAIVVATGMWLLRPDVASGASLRPQYTGNADLRIVKMPHGKVLYVVVDGDGIYLGNTRFDLPGAKAGVGALLREQKIRNLVIYATDLARYGDVIELYGSVDRKFMRWSTFSFRSLPIGTRKPLTGFLKPMCCYSADVENEGIESSDEVESFHPPKEP